MIQPVLGILVVRHLDGARVQPAKVSIGIHRNKKVFFIRHPQRDEIRGAFETDPIFSKLIDFACRALLGAFWSSSILALA